MAHRAAAEAFAEMMSFVPVDEAARLDLWRRMTGDDRHYHDAGHLNDLWELHRDMAAEAGLASTRSTVLLAAAIAYHDAVCVAGRRDNEERSAELWLQAASRGPMPAADRAWVADTIRASANHMASGAACGGDEAGRLRQWFLDLDLASLGAAARVFEENTRKLRLEAASIDEEAWRRSLRGFLTGLEESDAIYRSAPIRARFEKQARRNVRVCLAGL